MKCDIKATLHDAVSFWQVATFCLSPKSCEIVFFVIMASINQFILFPSIITVLPSYSQHYCFHTLHTKFSFVTLRCYCISSAVLHYLWASFAALHYLVLEFYCSQMPGLHFPEQSFAFYYNFPLVPHRQKHTLLKPLG